MMNLPEEGSWVLKGVPTVNRSTVLPVNKRPSGLGKGRRAFEAKQREARGINDGKM